MPKIPPEEYQQLKAFCAVLQKRMFASANFNIPPEGMPLALVEALETKSPAKARLSLGMFIGDVIDMTTHLAPSEVAEIDADLASRGIITLSAVRGRYSRKLKGIIKRGRIRNEAEFYLVANFVSSGGDGASVDDLRILQSLLHAFEASVSSRKS